MVNHVEIQGGEVLYRRLTAQHINSNGRPTSFGFKPRADEEEEISFLIGPQETVMEGYDGYGLATITAAQAIAAGARLEMDPDDATHVRAFLPGGKNERHRIAKKLALAATLLIPPTL